MQALQCPGFCRHCDRENKILTLTRPRNRLLLFGVLEDYLCQSRFSRKRLNREERATQKLRVLVGGGMTIPNMRGNMMSRN